MSWTENLKKLLTENKLVNLKLIKEDGKVKNVKFIFDNGETVNFDMAVNYNNTKTSI